MRFVVAISLALVLVACGDPALTELEYRGVVTERAAAYTAEGEQLRTTHLAQLERAVDDLVKELDGDAVEPAVLAETSRRSASLFAAVADSIGRYAADLDAVTPPATVQTAHDEYVAALVLSITGIGSMVEALTDATSFDDIDAAIGGSTFNDTQHRVDAACRNLEQTLIEVGVGGDLQCRES